MYSLSQYQTDIFSVSLRNKIKKIVLNMEDSTKPYVTCMIKTILY